MIIKKGSTGAMAQSGEQTTMIMGPCSKEEAPEESFINYIKTRTELHTQNNVVVENSVFVF